MPKVKITNVSDGPCLLVEIPEDIPLKKLLPVLVKKLGLSLPFFMDYEVAGSRFPNYGIMSKNQGCMLPLTSSLSESDIQDGDTLRILPNMRLGKPPLESIMTFASGQPFSENVIVIAVKVDGICTAVPIRRNVPLNRLADQVAWEIVKNNDHRSQIRERFLQLCESAGLAVFEDGLVFLGQATTTPILKNETTGTIIDIATHVVVGDSFQTGDCISINFEPRQDSITIELSDEQQDLLDQIHIYPTPEGEAAT